jgi:hypothetical protein
MLHNRMSYWGWGPRLQGIPVHLRQRTLRGAVFSKKRGVCELYYTATTKQGDNLT